MTDQEYAEALSFLDKAHPFWSEQRAHIAIYFFTKNILKEAPDLTFFHPSAERNDIEQENPLTCKYYNLLKARHNAILR